MFVLGVDTRGKKAVGEDDKQQSLKTRMGDKLSRMADMDLRREDAVRAEPYNMLLLESDPFLHSNRALRRELCITRGAIVFLLLLLSTTFCVLFFLQQRPGGCRDMEHMDKPNGKVFRQVDLRDDLETNAVDEPKNYPMATLKIRCSQTPAPGSDSGNIVWQLQDSVLAPDNVSFVVRQEGTYRISLQVTYRGIESTPCKDRIILSHRLNHYTKAYNADKAILEMEVYETVFCKKTTWRKSMYSEAVVDLGENDELRVNTSAISLLDCDGNVGIKTFLRVQFLKPPPSPF